VLRTRKHGVGTFALTTALLAPAAWATESLEFVQEHLPEIAMDNRYASLPLWNACVDDEETYCYGVNAGYARTHSGTLSIDGPMLSLSMAWPIKEDLRLTGFVFFDDFILAGGVEQRPLEVLFANPPLTMPADAEFTGLDGTARDVGLGVALNGVADWSWLPRMEWSAGLMWQRFALNDYRFDYRITEGPDAGTTGTVDYSATYAHISPFFGAAWPRARGPWQYSPHVQFALPLPRRGVEGRITGPGFDLTGNTADNGQGKHFGDPSVTIGFNVTYEPWDLTLDLGSTVTQALLEPMIHEGVKHNLMLSAYWAF
jgi:hypothetical protein